MPLLSYVATLSGRLYILLAGLTYILGAGIAKYLGYPLHGPLLVIGLVMTLLLQASMSWLAAAFRPLQEKVLEEAASEDRTRVGRAVLYAAIGALAAAAALAFSILKLEGASVVAASCLGFSTLVILFYSTPPMRGVSRGFGELLLAAQIGYLTPTLGFVLQAGSLHRLLNWCTVALTCMLLATLIALELPSHSDDALRGRATILMRLGWEHGLKLHHALLIISYMLLGASVMLGFSFSLIGPAFLTLPFALLQVFLLQGIARGAKPIWKLLRANAVAVFALTAYFLTLSFWLR